MAYNTKLVARFITSLERIERAFPPIFRKLILIGRVRPDVKLSAPSIFDSTLRGHCDQSNPVHTGNADPRNAVVRAFKGAARFACNCRKSFVAALAKTDGCKPILPILEPSIM